MYPEVTLHQWCTQSRMPLSAPQLIGLEQTPFCRCINMHMLLRVRVLQCSPCTGAHSYSLWPPLPVRTQHYRGSDDMNKHRLPPGRRIMMKLNSVARHSHCHGHHHSTAFVHRRPERASPDPECWIQSQHTGSGPLQMHAKTATQPYLNRDVGQFGRSRRVLLESTLRHVERFGGVVERPFERDGRREGVHLAQNVGGLVARHAVDFLLVGSAQRLVCGAGGRRQSQCMCVCVSVCVVLPSVI